MANPRVGCHELIGGSYIIAASHVHFIVSPGLGSQQRSGLQDTLRAGKQTKKEKKEEGKKEA